MDVVDEHLANFTRDIENFDEAIYALEENVSKFDYFLIIACIGTILAILGLCVLIFHGWKFFQVGKKVGQALTFIRSVQKQLDAWRVGIKNALPTRVQEGRPL